MQTTTIIDGVEVIVWNSVFEKDRENPFCVDGWPLSPNMRKAVFKSALEQCGLDENGRKLKDNPRKLKNRDRAAALRLVSSFEKISLELQEIVYDMPEEKTEADQEYGELVSELSTPVMQEKVRGIIAEFPVQPEPEPLSPEAAAKRDREREEMLREERWPISDEMRLALILVAMEIIGFRVSGEHNEMISEIEDNPSTNREIRAAIRVLTWFERLSLRRKALEKKKKAWKAKQPVVMKRTCSPEAIARINKLFDEECAIITRHELNLQRAAEHAGRRVFENVKL